MTWWTILLVGLVVSPLPVAALVFAKDEGFFKIRLWRRLPKVRCQKCRSFLADEAAWCKGCTFLDHKIEGLHRPCFTCKYVNFVPIVEDVKTRIRAQEIEDAQSEVEALFDEEKRKERARVN